MFAGLPYANCLETFYGNCGQCRCHNLWLPFATVCGYVSGPCGRQFGRLRLENCSASALMNTCACTIQCLPDCPTLIVWTNFTEMAGNGAPTTCGYHLGLSVIMCRNGCGSQFGRLRLEKLFDLRIDEHLCIHNLVFAGLPRTSSFDMCTVIAGNDAPATCG